MSLIDDFKESIIESEAKELGLLEADENYRILDDEQANYFLRRLEELEKDKEETITLCKSEIEKFTKRVNDFQESKLNTLNNTENYIKNLLKIYAEEKLADSKKKSLKLPFGTLQFRKSQDKYEYEDDVVLNYVQENNINNCLTTKVSLNKSELKKIGTIKDDKLYINDKEIPGITITKGTQTFDVKLT
jgi:phage host-nuclease inhibitor protein Gam